MCILLFYLWRLDCTRLSDLLFVLNFHYIAQISGQDAETASAPALSAAMTSSFS